MSDRPSIETLTQSGISLSLFQKTLLITDGSVTELVALYTGKPIVARKIDQQIVDECPPADFAINSPTPLMHRRILLCNAEDRTPYLYAKSVFILNRLDSNTQQQLIASDKPIGRIWKDDKTEMFREIIDMRTEQDAEIAAHFNAPPTQPLISRSYLLHQQRRPFGLITETFPIDAFA
ncbi:MAG: DUF98 domain-containing protein [Gammaproteobacteria bacterium]|nr:DUF98 domain-containing protein [Gammaproteobacteria bacterium]